jgi:hypothetical protein
VIDEFTIIFRGNGPKSCLVGFRHFYELGVGLYGWRFDVVCDRGIWTRFRQVGIIRVCHNRSVYDWRCPNPNSVSALCAPKAKILSGQIKRELQVKAARFALNPNV